uniref:Uncharacterized protein n=1 Tax=Cyprinus carpio TaxID=7962 RepID=A0A8C2JN92_CYPCA
MTRHVGALMDRWKGRVALTGASHGMKVVGCARNVEQIEVMHR